MENIIQGLSLSIAGISITFAALGLLIGVMVLLQHFFSPKLSAPESNIVELSSEAAAMGAQQLQSENEEVAAAIVVALNVLQAKSRAELGSGFGGGSDAWWVIGQMSQQRASSGQNQGRQ